MFIFSTHAAPSIIGLVVKFPLAMREPRVRFPNDASEKFSFCPCSPRVACCKRGEGSFGALTFIFWQGTLQKGGRLRFLITHSFKPNLSMFLNSLKNVVKSLWAKVRSAPPIISRMLCMDSWGMPRSTARMPVLAEMMGPIVDPHGQSLRTANS